MKYYVEWAGQTREIEIVAKGDALQVHVDGNPHTADVAATEDGDLLNLILDGRSYTYGARFENGHAVLSFHDREVRVAIEDERERQTRLATGGARGGSHQSEIKSVMPGVVKELRVAVGDRVEAGSPLLILEAMKMENEIRAPSDGVVQAIHVAAGQAVEKGAPLVELAPLDTVAPTEEPAHA
jgi:pyruvate carboxylase subunit B